MTPAHDAVILAAGGSRRLGRPKQLLRRDGETLIARVARLVLATAPARTIVVTGAHREEVAAATSGLDIEIVTNDAWTEGMASSLRAAARSLAGRDRPVLVTVVDQPALDDSHLRALLDAHRDDRDTVSAYGDAQGVPAVLRASTFARAATLRGDTGFRRLWTDANPRTVRADTLAHDLDDLDDLRVAIAAGWVDTSG